MVNLLPISPNSTHDPYSSTLSSSSPLLSRLFPQLLSLAWQPAIGKIQDVSNFYLEIMEATVLVLYTIICDVCWQFLDQMVRLLLCYATDGLQSKCRNFWHLIDDPEKWGAPELNSSSKRYEYLNQCDSIFVLIKWSGLSLYMCTLLISN